MVLISIDGIPFFQVKRSAIPCTFAAIAFVYASLAESLACTSSEQ